MFSTDYPYKGIQLAVNWIESSEINEAQPIKVGTVNAARVLKLS